MDRLTDYMSKEDLEVVLGDVELDSNEQITFEAFANMMRSNPFEQVEQQPQLKTWQVNSINYQDNKTWHSTKPYDLCLSRFLLTVPLPNLERDDCTNLISSPPVEPEKKPLQRTKELVP